ncbi:hypothetical protein ACWD00_39725 [Streptomyces viridiviolaceus]
MVKTQNVAPEQTSGPWQLLLGREGLRVHAGRHLQVSMSLTLLGWLLTLAGFVGAGSYWSFLG